MVTAKNNLITISQPSIARVFEGDDRFQVGSQQRTQQLGRIQQKPLRHHGASHIARDDLIEWSMQYVNERGNIIRPLHDLTWYPYAVVTALFRVLIPRYIVPDRPVFL